MTITNLSKCFIGIAMSFASGLAVATPAAISAHPDYKNAKAMIEKQGREASINNIVSMQKEITRKHGSHVDDYTESIGIFGMPNGLLQKLELKVDALLKDINNDRVNKGKKSISKERLIKEIQEGGVMHIAQIRMLCSTPATRAAIDGGIDYRVVYYDTKMSFIGDIQVNNSACLRIDLLP